MTGDVESEIKLSTPPEIETKKFSPRNRLRPKIWASGRSPDQNSGIETLAVETETGTETKPPRPGPRPRRKLPIRDQSGPGTLT